MQIETIGINPLKARNGVTNKILVSTIVSLFALIFISEFMLVSFALYMTWVY